MDELKIIEHEGIRVLTTQQLAEVYETDANNINQNFKRNKERFVEGRDYYLLKGDDLKGFKSLVTNSHDPSIKYASVLYLWTERGANRHSKILDTDKAWQQFDILEETYFKVKHNMIASRDSYMIENPIERAKRWIEEEMVRIEQSKLIEQQGQQLIEQKPLVGFAQQVSDSSDCVDVGEFAKTIRDENIKMGRNILFKWLKSNHYLMSNNNPYQKYINNGMFKVVEVVKKTPYGTKVFTKTLITGIGQIRLLEKIRESYGGNK